MTLREVMQEFRSFPEATADIAEARRQMGDSAIAAIRNMPKPENVNEESHIQGKAVVEYWLNIHQSVMGNLKSGSFSLENLKSKMPSIYTGLLHNDWSDEIRKILEENLWNPIRLRTEPKGSEDGDDSTNVTSRAPSGTKDSSSRSAVRSFLSFSQETEKD